jgi:hypothetical protein
VAAGVAATWPAVASFGSAFMANDRPGFGEPPGGDHLQSVYRFWLVGHQLERGRAPWQDPYSFQPVVEPQTVVGGWPYGIPFWPLEAAFGPVVAWNLLLFATIVLAGLFTYLWLRCLALGPWPAAIGGLIFAIAPYRLEQSAGHLLGWAAVFLPLMLWGIEQSRLSATLGRKHAWGALAAAALVSVPLSGQVHLALGSIPLAVAYAVVRFRPVAFGWTLGGALAAIGVGLAIRYALIAGSAEEGGRSTGELRHYSAEPLDFLNRWHAPRSEEFVYLGWLTLVLALVGLILLARRDRTLTVVLGLAALVPILLALGTNLPGYAAMWRNAGPLHFTRVPGRLLPLADLALGALAAVACAEALRRSGRRTVIVACALVALVALDLVVQPLSATAADPGNKAYAALDDAPSGRALELPLFEPGVHYGSVYDYYELQAPRGHPNGYSTLAPEKAFDFFQTHVRLNCGVWLPGDDAELETLGVTRILFHRGLYRQAHRLGVAFAESALWDAGWHPAGSSGSITLWAPGDGSHPARSPALPPPGPPVLCTGWRGRTMMWREATLWVYGEGPLRLRFEADAQTFLRVFADGQVADQIGFVGRGIAETTLTGEGWHPLVLVESTRGVRLVAVEH